MQHHSPWAVCGNCQGSFPVCFQLVLKTSLIYISIADLAFKWTYEASHVVWWIYDFGVQSPDHHPEKETGQLCLPHPKESLRWRCCNAMHPTLVFLTQKLTKAPFWGIEMKRILWSRLLSLIYLVISIWFWVIKLYMELIGIVLDFH